MADRGLHRAWSVRLRQRIVLGQSYGWHSNPSCDQDHSGGKPNADSRGLMEIDAGLHSNAPHIKRQVNPFPLLGHVGSESAVQSPRIFATIAGLPRYGPLWLLLVHVGRGALVSAIAVSAWTGRSARCRNRDPPRVTEDLEILPPCDGDERHPTCFGDADGKRRRRRHRHQN